MSDLSQQLETLSTAPHLPGATYRLQFNQQFTFNQAAEIAEYLRDLGITDVYASPLFQAGPESTHGYDVCSFAQFSPSLGGREAFDSWSARLRQLGLGLVLDMVPNHMGSDLSNAWWTSVLALGRRSPFATHFDIDWQPLKSDLHDKVLLPTLEGHYAQVLESGKLRLVHEHGALAIAYHDRRFPLAPHSYAPVLEEASSALSGRAKTGLADELLATAAALRQQHAAGKLGLTETEALKKQLQSWMQNSPPFRDALERTCATFNGQPGQPRSFDQLHALLQEQHYRLAFWRVGPHEINYRRFFDVTQLVSLRMELPEVFDASHCLVFELLRSGQLNGLRIDHPDGLWNPKEYFLRLQAGFLKAKLPASSSPNAAEVQSAVSEWLRQRLAPLEHQERHRPIQDGMRHTLEAPRSDPEADKAPRLEWPLFVVAEKILSGEEPLRRDWPVAGTTGYDFLNQVNGVFVDGRNSGAFDRLFQEFTGEDRPLADWIYHSKKRILELSLVSELRALAQRLKQVALKTRYGQDFAFDHLHAALAEVIAAFPVYRTYVTEQTDELMPLERFYIEQAVAQAKRRQPALEPVLLDFLQDLLRLRSPADFDDEGRRLHRDFVLRFQQLTGPVMAKGLEDTAFYNYNRLLSLNEVGGEPDRFGVSVDQFHQSNLRNAEQWPHTLLATATHDTKRGEDVRARLNVLSEIPEEWSAAVQRWALLNRDKRPRTAGTPGLHPNDEYLLYQTLVGAWPLSSNAEPPLDPATLASFKERVAAYMTKALREAKTRTQWTDPNAAYEEATQQFIDRVLDPSASREFLKDLAAFQRPVAFYGQINSLAQLLLKITSPGVPDFYQGTELWDLSLVDPDNRRPVDYPLRKQWLAELRKQLAQAGQDRSQLLGALLGQSHTGQVKLFVAAQALALRQQFAELFRMGAYRPLPATGTHGAHLCAFARVWKNQAVITIVPRLVRTLQGDQLAWPLGETAWQNTSLPLPAELTGRYTNRFTGEEMNLASTEGAAISAAAALRQFPVALLARTSEAPGR